MVDSGGAVGSAAAGVPLFGRWPSWQARRRICRSRHGIPAADLSGSAEWLAALEEVARRPRPERPREPCAASLVLEAIKLDTRRPVRLSCSASVSFRDFLSRNDNRKRWLARLCRSQVHVLGRFSQFRIARYSQRTRRVSDVQFSVRMVLVLKHVCGRRQ